jgi:hypothetical protein
MTKRVKKITRAIVMLTLTVTWIGVGLSSRGFSQYQPPAQPPAAASLNFLVNLFMKQTVEKFDTVFLEGRVISGEIKNTELTFRLEDGQSVTYKTGEIVALTFGIDRVYIALQSGQRLNGQMLTGIEIALAGFENQRITLTPGILEQAAATVLLKGQLQHMNTSEFQELLNQVLNLLTRNDVLVLKDDSVFAGIVTNQVFQINDLFFNRQDIAEIICGPPDQLRPWVGPLVIGSIQNNMVTLDVIDAQLGLARFTSLRVKLTFSIPTVARILFLDRTISFLPGERELVPLLLRP